jgi:hypothetical protein
LANKGKHYGGEEDIVVWRLTVNGEIEAVTYHRDKGDSNEI